jgi:hypothetical protein
MPIIDYVINYDKIVNELCENRAKPELLCNGFCVIKKEVKTSEKDHSEKKFVKNSVKVLEANLPDHDLFLPNFITQIKEISLIDFYQEINSNPIKTSIFHPPIV